MLTMKVYRSKYYSPLFQNRALAPLQIPASLCEGPIYLLLCWVIILLLKSTSWRAPLSFAFITISLHWVWPDWISFTWITMSSQSLVFKGALHLCFAVLERASEIPFCYIMLWLFWESVVIWVLLLLVDPLRQMAQKPAKAMLLMKIVSFCKDHVLNHAILKICLSCCGIWVWKKKIFV